MPYRFTFAASTSSIHPPFQPQKEGRVIALLALSEQHCISKKTEIAKNSCLMAYGDAFFALNPQHTQNNWVCQLNSLSFQPNIFMVIFHHSKHHVFEGCFFFKRSPPDFSSAKNLRSKKTGDVFCFLPFFPYLQDMATRCRNFPPQKIQLRHGFPVGIHRSDPVLS